MTTCTNSPYLLPTISFIGGETQNLLFNIYSPNNKDPFSLSGCEANFSVSNYLNKTGSPVISKEMEVQFNKDNTVDNVLSVEMSPSETVSLSGKFIYQIIIKDISGDVEIPHQGILLITNNISKSFAIT